MKHFALLCLIALTACSKESIDSYAKPIRKDVTPPTANIISPDMMMLGATTDITITASDDMGLKALYYYENDMLSRTFTTNNIPGSTALNWSYTFPFSLYTYPITIKVMVVDLAGNYYITSKTIYRL